MAKTTDWFPATRDGQLAMAKEWITVLHTKGVQWDITDAAISELEDWTEDAGNALTAAKNEATRTPVTTARCRDAFKALENYMRDLKKRKFYVPPLTDAALISLGLHPRDPTPTPSGPPTAQVTIETFLKGRHELGVKIIYVTGSPADPANKGYRIWYSVTAQGEIPPETPDGLRKTFYTKRKKDVIEFDFGDSGKTAYFAAQIENDGKKGPWGPLVNALIP
jgi:hypothetical protein